MGLFDEGGPLNKAVNWVPAYWAGDKMDLFGTNAARDARDLGYAQDEERRRWKQQQLGLLASKKGPEMTAEREARIKALEQEGNTSLEQDPHFQTQMRRATGGGAQALSGIQNQQAASGAVGGFANQGSIQDVYDRLGTQLAGIGQEQHAFKEAAANKAADARQSFSDSKIAFENAQTDARMAIEAGDHQALSDAMNRMAASKAAADAALRNNVLAMGQMVVGAYTGNPKAMQSSAQAMQNAPDPGAEMNQGQGPTQGAYNNGNYFSSNYDSDYKPYYQTRRGY